MSPIRLSEGEKLLCLAGSSRSSASPDLSELLSKNPPFEIKFFDLAQKNQVDAILGHILLEHPTKTTILARWYDAHRTVNERLTGYLHELDRLADILATGGVPLVALKNAGIARGIFPCAGCCPMGDLDVLVRKSDFRKAHQIMLAEGYHFEFRSPLEKAELDAAEQGGGAEYWKILPNGEKLWLELQWRPVAGRWIRPDQEPSADELIGRSIPISGTAVRLLCPEDNLLQVSLHTAKHTYVRAPGFRLHLDVDRIVHYQKIDWEIFLKRVRDLKVKTAVYFSLAMPKSLFNTPIPDHVLNSLKPSGWKENLLTWWIRIAGIFNPDEKKFSKIGYILFNMLLYDDLAGLLRSIFPEKKWMMEKYNISNEFLLPYYHVKRLLNLALKRAQT